MSSPRVVGNSFDGVRGEQGVEGWFISLDEAQLYVVGNEAGGTMQTSRMLLVSLRP
jgi:hypothetical protein